MSKPHWYGRFNICLHIHYLVINTVEPEKSPTAKREFNNVKFRNKSGQLHDTLTFFGLIYG